jgi:hypothetical protein
MAFAEIENAARKDAGRAEWQLRLAQAFQTIVLPALIASIAWYRDQILQIGGSFFFVLLGAFVLLQVVLFAVSAHGQAFGARSLLPCEGFEGQRRRS